MHGLDAANLIRVFDFYLAVMALFSFLRRYAVYRDTFALVVAARGRWPRLTGRMKQHSGLLLNWPTLRPAALALVLMAAQLTASRLLWPQASLKVGDVTETWWLGAVLVVAALPMLLIDGYFLLRVGRFDRAETEQYLDKAEGWAGTWKAAAVRAATLGRVNPNRMVDEELKKGLSDLGAVVNWSLWWVSAQAGARLGCGLTIWLLWAVS